MKADPSLETVKEYLKVVEGVTDQKIEVKAALHLLKGVARSNSMLPLDEELVEYNKAIELNPRFALA